MKLSDAVAFRIKNLLTERQMTQYRLEKKTAIHHNTMHAIIHAHYQAVNLKTLFLIMVGLEVTPAEFFNDPIFTRDDLEID